MKKNIVLFFLLISSFAFSQNEEKKIWNLLLSNKRTEARNLFNKNYKSQVNKNIDYLILDAMIEIESGKIDFDETFAKEYLKFPESKYYVYALIKKQMLMDDTQTLGFNDDKYRIIDLLATDPNLSNHPAIIYKKAVADRNRKNYKGFQEGISKLNIIDKWQFCGVFENLNDSGLEIEYEPEVYAKNDKLFDANSNGKVGWYNPAINSKEGYQIFENESEYGNGIIYSQTFIDNPIQKEVFFNFGAGASIKIFLNDAEIYANNLINQSDIEAFKLKINLPKGMNRLLVKSSLNNGNDYFIFSITDTDGKPLTDLTHYDIFKEYQRSTLEQLNPIHKNTVSEDFLQSKIAQFPENILYKILLFDTYLHNKKLELAQNIIEDLDAKYPNSSLLKLRLADYYSYKGDQAKSEEIIKNIDVQDPDYYYNVLMKIQDENWMRSANVVEIEKLRDKSKAYPASIITSMLEFLLASRSTNIQLMIEKVDQILANSNNSEFYISLFAQLYDSVGKDKAKTIMLLEKLYSESENYRGYNQLIKYYSDANKKAEIKKMYLERHTTYPYHNQIASDYIDALIEEKKYDEAMMEIDKCLAQFPYSFISMQTKGMIYNHKMDIKNAEVYFRKSLSHHSGNSRLRKILYDVTKLPDEIEMVKTKDIYQLIKEKRNSKLKGDYGVTVLLDEYIVNIFPEGGRKSLISMVYEVTGTNGIEELKEYGLNSNSVTLLKSEIVKPNGSIVPAEVGGDQLVFTNLQVGDVIYIEYEAFDNSTGRFYKDFNLSYTFNGIYPCVQSVFGIISPKDLTFDVNYSEKELSPKTKKVNNKNYTYWIKADTDALQIFDNYAPNFNDVVNVVRVGTIKNWKEIANWYCDLVQKTLKEDKITIDTFKTIFPNGITTLSEDEKAKMIYKYIEDTITYSSVDFRQSGYVPQKPSTTINTKLGDCKDVSTLYVALAKMAGIKANLVLVLTNNNGINNAKLPGLDFNHCIVKVEISGKEYFIELTDKYLPFKAMPMSLCNANALVIDFDKKVNENAKLISIPFDNAAKNSSSSTVEVLVDEKVRHFKVTSKVQGCLKSYYNQIFSDATTEDTRKKEFEDDLNSRLTANVTFQSAKVISNDVYENDMVFESEFSVPEKLQSVGSLKIFSIPFLDKVYTRNIIEADTRNYDINYLSYENCKEYNSEIILNLSEGKKFSEIPETKLLNYKGHDYAITFELVKPNSLKINRKVTLSWENISKDEYPGFKKYVEDIIELEKQIVGFK